jgi:hypothetical protein
VAESFFSSLKKERIKKRIYKTRDLAKADVFDYIEVFYSRTRRRSHLGGVSPEPFERASQGGSGVSCLPRGVQSQRLLMMVNDLLQTTWWDEAICFSGAAGAGQSAQL